MTRLRKEAGPRKRSDIPMVEPITEASDGPARWIDRVAQDMASAQDTYLAGGVHYVGTTGTTTQYTGNDMQSWVSKQ